MKANLPKDIKKEVKKLSVKSIIYLAIAVGAFALQFFVLFRTVDYFTRPFLCMPVCVAIASLGLFKVSDKGLDEILLLGLLRALRGEGIRLYRTEGINFEKDSR